MTCIRGNKIEAALQPSYKNIEISSIRNRGWYLFIFLARWRPTVMEVLGGFTYNPKDVNVWRYGWRRGCMNKIYLKSHPFADIFAEVPPLSPCQQDWCSRFIVCLSLPTPSILHHSDLVKSLSTATKILRIFRKLSRRSTVTRPWRERRCEQFSKRRRRGNQQRLR